MGGVNWKYTLSSWAHKTGFIENTVQSFILIDLTEFFDLYKEKMTEKVEINGDVVQFIRDNYPQFEPTLYKTRRQITFPDYIYVYSLLLHFSCVRCPHPWFQQVCNTLEKECQIAVAKFFEFMIRNERFDRNSIQQAIDWSTLPVRRLSLPTVPITQMPVPIPAVHLLNAMPYGVNLFYAQPGGVKYENGYLELQQHKEHQHISNNALIGKIKYPDKKMQQSLTRTHELRLQRHVRQEDKNGFVTSVENHTQQARVGILGKFSDSSGGLLVSPSMHQHMNCITTKPESNGFQVSFNVQWFQPNEVNVKVQDNMVIVEGKHEERQDKHGFISRHFTRKYVLPKEVDAAQLESTLSSDGILTVKAPQMKPEKSERVINIQQTGPARKT